MPEMPSAPQTPSGPSSPNRPRLLIPPNLLNYQSPKRIQSSISAVIPFVMNTNQLELPIQVEPGSSMDPHRKARPRGSVGCPSQIVSDSWIRELTQSQLGQQIYSHAPLISLIKKLPLLLFSHNSRSPDSSP